MLSTGGADSVEEEVEEDEDEEEDETAEWLAVLLGGTLLCDDD